MITSGPLESDLPDASLYDGRAGDELAALLGVPRVVVFDEIGSTLDVAHALGERGAAAGTLVIADAQTAGRGRMGRSWRSTRGAGVWLTLVERPPSDESLGVLALRVALALAAALDGFSDLPVRLKWPNDLYVGDGKLAGVLVEARWRGARLDWLALGVGINVRVPANVEGAGLSRATDRVAILRTCVPALRGAARAAGRLTEDELARFRERDLALGRRCVEPGRGIVAGIRSDGALLVDTAEGPVAYHAGSLLLAPDHSLGTSP